jgi:hypothetical protein
MEVLVCATLFLIVSSGIVMSIISANRAINRVNHKYVAMNYARDFIDKTIANSRDIYTERGVLDPNEGEGFANRLDETDGWQNHELPESSFKNNLSGALEYMIENGKLVEQATGEGKEVIWVDDDSNYSFKKLTVNVSWNETNPSESKEQNWVIYIADKRKDLN